MADLLYQAVLERFTGEEFDEIFDFDGIIPESTTVTSHTVQVTRKDGTNVTDTVKVSSSHATTIVTVTLNTGSEETSYIVKVSVVASDLTPAVRAKLLHVTDFGAFV